MKAAYLVKQGHVAETIKMDWDRYKVFVCAQDFREDSAEELRGKVPPNSLLCAAFYCRGLPKWIRRSGSDWAISQRNAFRPEWFHHREGGGVWLDPWNASNFIFAREPFQAYAEWIAENLDHEFDVVYLDVTNDDFRGRFRPPIYEDEDPVALDAFWRACRDFFILHLKRLRPGLLVIGNGPDFVRDLDGWCVEDVHVTHETSMAGAWKTST
jgi:hypothetical protein